MSPSRFARLIRHATEGPLRGRGDSGGADGSGAGRRVGPLVLGVLLLADLGAAAFLLSPRRTIQETIEPGAMVHVAGLGYQVEVRRAVSFPFALPADTGAGAGSPMRVYEAGKPLGPGHAMAQDVLDRGLGLFTHWSDGTKGYLCFSSSDGTDPRANGRPYRWEAQVVPDRRLVTGLLLALGAQLALGLARLSERVRFRDRRRADAGAAAGLLLVACLLQSYVLASPRPRILRMSDAGMIASIVAASTHPDQFASDATLPPGTSLSFYATVLRPVVAAIDFLVSDLGTSYLLLYGPLAFLQSLGFYRLGVALLSSRGHGFLLALLTLAPVYTNGGDLWGIADEPLTRMLYGAVLPWLMLAFLRSWGRRGAPAGLALLLAATLYLHPVSQPSVALACILGAMMADDGVPPRTRLARASACGLLLVAFMAPYAIVYFSSGVGGMDRVIGGALGAEGKRQFLASYFGPLYYDVRLAVKALAEGGAGSAQGPWGWRWLVWTGGALALFVLARSRKPPRRAARFLLFFLLGIAVASLGISAVDQFVAARLQRQPALIDLVRNTRFLIPVLLAGAVLGLDTLPALRRRVLGAPLGTACIVALTLAWWHSQPLPMVRWLHARLGLAPRGVHAAYEGASEIIAAARGVPAGSLFLPIGEETVGQALRYGALRPVAFLVKDMNLMLYGGGGDVRRWLLNREDMERFRTARDAAAADALLGALVARTGAQYLLVDLASLTPEGRRSVAAAGRLFAARGRWAIVALGSGAAARPG